ncbi:ribosomal-processing cysteine protease Prp [Litchfieldia alkalitelluris]|uniref:ribosomal-processing cysteine protease Prp n=1 Tax=Litchfieldia alkalitelluris TaxID=304268 RepID=UPI0009974254|nr:ribosomal-processing cysteine protease Prp [Litchfieldia alkalitelluris]
MIKVTITRSEHGSIDSFTMSGHANFAKRGQDIVCAGASAVSIGTVNAIVALTNVVPEIEQGGNGGFLRCVIPNGLAQEIEEKVQLLLEGMLISLETIEKDYGQHIKITK